MIGPNPEVKERSRYPFLFVCNEQGCYWRTSHHSQEEAEYTRDKHLATTCPLTGKIKVPQQMLDAENPESNRDRGGKLLVHKMWDELDDTIDRIKLEQFSDGERAKELKGYARGLAFCLQTLLFNFYVDDTAVLRQSQRRWKMRKKEVEWEPTPGYNFNPPPPAAKTTAPTDVSQTKSTKQKELSITDLEGIRLALKSGTIPAEMLAQAYKVPLSMIESLRVPV